MEVLFMSRDFKLSTKSQTVLDLFAGTHECHDSKWKDTQIPYSSYIAHYIAQETDSHNISPCSHGNMIIIFA